MSAPDLAHVESAAEQAADLDAAPAAEQADATAPTDDLEGRDVVATGANGCHVAEHAEPPAHLPPTNPTIGDPTMNEEEKQALAPEAKQLAKSIAAAKAAGQSARAEALEARRQRVIARVSA